VPKVERWAYWCGETIEIAPAVAAGMAGLATGGTLQWSLDGHAAGGLVAVDPAEPLSAQALARIEVRVPELATPSRLRIAFVLRDPQGAELARNSLDISAYPRIGGDASLKLWSPHAEILAHLSGLGYASASSPEAADLVVVRSVDAADVEAIRTGARYLLLAGDDPDQKFIRRDEPPMQPPYLLDHADPIPEGGSPNRSRRSASGTGLSDMDRRFPTIGVHERNGTMWRGDWITSFNWLRRHGAFAVFPGEPILDLAFDRVIPHHVLTGFRPWEFESRVHAGVFVGWAHKPAALIAERPFGRGKMVMSTFRLREDAPGCDPVASYLAEALLRTTFAR
jgi:hypothetical protein